MKKLALFFFYIIAFNYAIPSKSSWQKKAITIKPHRHSMYDVDFSGREDKSDGFHALKLHNTKSTFIIHGYSGLGKSSLISFMAPDQKNISGFSDKNMTGFTRSSQVYKVEASGAMKIIDTPGLNENGLENREMVLDSLDEALSLAKSKANKPIRQIYYFLKYNRQNELPNKLKLLFHVYGNELKDYITFVVALSDTISSVDADSKFFQNIIHQIKKVANINYTKSKLPKVLFVSTNFQKDKQSNLTIGCMLQLMEHMSKCAKDRLEFKVNHLPVAPMKSIALKTREVIRECVELHRLLNRKIYRVFVAPKFFAKRKDVAMRYAYLLSYLPMKIYRDNRQIPNLVSRRDDLIYLIQKSAREYAQFASLIGSGDSSSDFSHPIIKETNDLVEILSAETDLISIITDSFENSPFFKSHLGQGRLLKNNSFHVDLRTRLQRGFHFLGFTSPSLMLEAVKVPLFLKSLLMDVLGLKVMPESPEKQAWDQEYREGFKQAAETLVRLHSFNDLFTEIWDNYPIWEGGNLIDSLSDARFDWITRVKIEETFTGDLPQSRTVNSYLRRSNSANPTSPTTNEHESSTNNEYSLILHESSRKYKDDQDEGDEEDEDFTNIDEFMDKAKQGFVDKYGDFFL